MLNITPNFAQERGLNMLRRTWKAHDSFMVYAPTGSGKQAWLRLSPPAWLVVVCVFCLSPRIRS